MQIDSAGLGSGAARKYRMPDVAQRAVVGAAKLLDPLHESPESLLALQEEARQHRSRQVTADDISSPDTTIICLLAKEGITQFDSGPRLLAFDSVRWHPVADNGFKQRQLRGGNDRHPDVIRAYEAQAIKIAEIVKGDLISLFTGAHSRDA